MAMDVGQRFLDDAENDRWISAGASSRRFET